MLMKLDKIPLNKKIPQSKLNIEDKKRSNLFAWKGQFSPQLIEVLLEHYCKPDFNILDPFLGSGTVLIESARKNIKAFGTEINPAAYCISSIYKFINLSKKDRAMIIKDFETIINDEILIKYDFFYNPESAEKLSDILKQALINLLNSISFQYSLILMECLIIILDFYKNDITIEKIICKWNKIKEIIFHLPFTSHEINVYNCDARSIPLPENTIDLVVTSPPYINVFNYHQQYRASIEKIGWNLLTVAKSEFGSNRKNRGNRFYTVIQYILDMYECFIELKRVCKLNSNMIFIIGRESNVCKTPFYNSEILCSVAQLAGLDIKYRQERFFINRFGKEIYEDIIYFNNKMKSSQSNDLILSSFIEEILKEALTRVPKESETLLKNAIEMLHTIKSSPLYSYQKEGA